MVIEVERSKPTNQPTKMRYLPTIDLWNDSTQRAVIFGQLKLQPGQWVSCGGGKPSRFVKTTGRSLWVAHPQGSAKATSDRFMALLGVSKRAK